MMTKVLSCVHAKGFSLSLDLSGPLQSLETKDELGPCCVIFFPASEDIWHGFPKPVLESKPWASDPSAQVSAIG